MTTCHEEFINDSTLTCVSSQQGGDYAHHRTWSVNGDSNLGQRLFFIKEVVMHVEQCQFSLRDELCIVRGKLGEEIVQVEAPDVQVGRVGIWTQGGLCECVEREKVRGGGGGDKTHTLYTR